ncbi:hypothetical protein EI94DRAFT_688674 [Lactarius quietus]|nr:hypothetical protein EI94DRAFT_688674 [Lactarius quietus]
MSVPIAESPMHFHVRSQKAQEGEILHGHRAKTPIVSAIVSSAGVLAIWAVALLGFLWKQYKKRIRANRRAARGLPPKVKKPKKPMPTFIVPPDPAVITGQREPGERAIPPKHRSSGDNTPRSAGVMEPNERQNTLTEGQLHEEMIARQVFSKHSSLDKHEKRASKSTIGR